MNLNDEWESFLNNEESSFVPDVIVHGPAPTSTPIYISTNTIISFLNQPIDLKNIFWKLPILPYNTSSTGIIKKQMKFNSSSKEEVDFIEKQMQGCDYSHTVQLHHIENTTILYKDIRKITIGVSKKDIISYRIKLKGAFYNCFVVFIRILVNETFKEFHVKIFNTGKIEIPGIQDRAHLKYIINILLDHLRVYYPMISYSEACEEVVLINSNFNCGYFINRDLLYEKLRYVYGISAIYDPCSYPGIQCKIYYTEDNDIVSTIQPKSVSFMVFRTGSILIVGKCSLEIIHKIYEFLSKILYNEYAFIVDKNCVHVKKELSTKKFSKSICLTNL